MGDSFEKEVIAVREEFSVVDEGDGWLAVDKGAPLIVHPANNRGNEATLLGGLQVLLAYDLVNGSKLSIINRLDRETSGIVLVATRRSIARELGRSMERREILKEYIAFVWGWPKWDKMIVDAPILRKGEVLNSKIYVKQMVHEGGKSCTTEMEVMKRSSVRGRKMAMLRILPRTGRMHQIRVHCAHVGHPIVGDKIYGASEDIYLKFIEEGMDDEMLSELVMSRHALHASKMQVKLGGKGYAWSANLPEDMSNLFINR